MEDVASPAAGDGPRDCSVGGRWGLADDDPGVGTSNVRVQFRSDVNHDVPATAVHNSGGAGPG